MELFILDDSFSRADIVDEYVSLIWTERFNSLGDFELVVFSSQSNRAQLRPGVRLSLSTSYRVMVVETVEDGRDSQGNAVLTIKGRSLEKILEDRVARPNAYSGLEEMPVWIVPGTAKDICEQVFERICMDGEFDPRDVIPYLSPGSIYPPGTIDFDDEVHTVEIKPQSVLNVLTDMCQAYSMGFRLVLDPIERESNGDPMLYFNIYPGSDRTSGQTTHPPVIFSNGLENLLETTELTSIAGLKTIAYVYHMHWSQEVSLSSEEGGHSGFDRRVLFVDATDFEVPERPYVVSEAHLEAINFASRLDTNLPEQEEAFRKLASKRRLGTSEKNWLTNSQIDSTPGLNSTQRSYIKAARDQNYAYDSTEENTIVHPELRRRGNEALRNQRTIRALDGEISQFSKYVYDTDYCLGDLVELQSEDGVVSKMRVVEQIFVSDAEGTKQYPTLVSDQLITPGSWFDFPYAIEWEYAEGTWDDQP